MIDRGDAGPFPGWEWDSTLEFDGVSHRVRWLPSPIDAWQRAVFVEGLPERHVDTFLAAAQESDSKPAWHVEERAGESGEERLARARERFRFDVDVYESRFVCAFGEGPDRRLHPIGCGAARRRVTADFETSSWVVIGRLIVLPELRQKGLAGGFAAQFLTLSRVLCGEPATGFVMETRSGPTRRLTDRASATGLLDVVRIEPRRRSGADDETFVSFYPGARRWAMARAEAALAEHTFDAAVRDLVEEVHRAWLDGATTARCARMGTALGVDEAAFAAAADWDERLRVHLDFLRVLRAWGVLTGSAEIS